MSDKDYDLVVIGSGPGGYIAAIRAAQLGMKTACVEKDATLGGTCLNVGCIPSKALLESSERFEQARHDAASHGIVYDNVRLDLDAMMKRKRGVVEQLTRGVAGLFKKNNVEHLSGLGTIVDAGTVKVTDGDGNEETVTTDKILVATGSVVAGLPGVEFDGDRVVTSTEALEFDEVPGRLIVIGAGVIGLELGSVWSRLGSNVTILEYLPEILGGRADKDVAKRGLRTFKKQGLEFKLEVKVTSASIVDGEVEVTYEDRNSGETETITGDRLLVAVGRKPCTEGLGAEEAGVELDDRGRIVVDDDYKTSVDGIYAIGDVIPGAMLAHKAEHEGVVCVEKMNGHPAHIMYDAVPDVVYTWPEIASVGRTEEELEEAGVPFKVGKFPFMANGRAKALGSTDGFVKLIAHAEHDRVLGCHILGPHAGDLVAEVATIMEFGGSAEDIYLTTHAHPTLSEVVKEAALAVHDRTLNL